MHPAVWESIGGEQSCEEQLEGAGKVGGGSL